MTLENQKDQIQKLNEAFQNGSLGVSHKQYVAMFNKIKNYNSVSNQVKRFGAKVTKDISGYYIYNGVNFTAKFNIEYCETSSWTVDIYSEDADEIVVRAFDCNGDYENIYQTKKDTLWALLSLDKESTK